MPAISDTPPNAPQAKNVFGEPLQLCCGELETGFYRDGYCRTGPADAGRHVVCAKVTEAFLRFSASRGNDLMTPRPDADFPGLEYGDRWCLCAMRWKEAYEAGVAPPVFLAATAEAALEIIPFAMLKEHAHDLN